VPYRDRKGTNAERQEPKLLQLLSHPGTKDTRCTLRSVAV
jgi:hypothetical protein